jgi:hypothetical protein
MKFFGLLCSFIVLSVNQIYCFDEPNDPGKHLRAMRQAFPEVKKTSVSTEKFFNQTEPQSNLSKRRHAFSLTNPRGGLFLLKATGEALNHSYIDERIFFVNLYNAEYEKIRRDFNKYKFSPTQIRDMIRVMQDQTKAYKTEIIKLSTALDDKKLRRGEQRTIKKYIKTYEERVAGADAIKIMCIFFLNEQLSAISVISV